MSPFIIRVTKKRELNDSRKGVEDFLDGLVVAFRYYCEREDFLTCLSDVNNPDDVMISIGFLEMKGNFTYKFGE